jgi:hypothetical protein
MPSSVVLVLLLQAAAPAPGPASAPAAHQLPRIVLPLVGPAPCNGNGDEVVVCGRRDPYRYRLKPLPDQQEAAALPKAETTLFGNVKGSATVDKQQMPQGAVSNRVMLHLKMPF